MFARVITAEVADGDFEGLIRLTEKQLPGARERPGFAGFYLLLDEESGRTINLSLWESREDMEAVAAGTSEGIHDEGAADAGMTSMRLETFEVAVRA